LVTADPRAGDSAKPTRDRVVVTADVTHGNRGVGIGTAFNEDASNVD
jgi:hypothetical protein